MWSAHGTCDLRKASESHPCKKRKGGPPAKVKLSSTSGATTTVTSTGSHFSASAGDISITATTSDGASSSPFTMTARTPWELTPSGSPSTVCDATYAYTTNISYNVVDNLSNPISGEIYWNEVLGACQSENGSSWGSICIASSPGSTPITDILGGPQLSRNPVPTPKCDSPPTGVTPYEMVQQTIYVGSDTAGAGVVAQTDFLTYYLDQGADTSIVLPPPPPQ
jgi:hypothetical protein